MSEWKDTDLGKIPISWQVLPIGNLGDVTKLAGFEYTKYIKYVEDGEIIALRALNVREGILDLTNVKRIYKSVSDNLIRSKLFVGDILLTYVGANIGQFALVDKNDKYHLAPNICRIRVGEKCLPNFLYSFFRTKYFRENLANYSVGSSQPTLPMGNIRQILILLPPLPEQKAIASVLSSLDDKIEMLHRQNKTLETMAETLFRQWFVEEAQDDWEYLKLSEVLQTVLGGTPSTKNPEFWDGDIPWINSGEVNNFRIIKGSKHITELGLNKSNTKLLPKGTTVLAITGATLGQISLLEIETCANQSVVGIIPNDRIPKAFVYFWVKHKINKVMLCETGGAQPHINKNDINETEIVIPDKKRTQKVINFINPLFDKITANSFQILTLEKLRDTLLSKLMSGKVRVEYEQERDC